MAADGDLDDESGILLLTRLRPPLVRAGTLERTTLLQSLDAASLCRVILVTGAAGYGKTVLLTQWYEHRLSQGLSLIHI